MAGRGYWKDADGSELRWMRMAKAGKGLKRIVAMQVQIEIRRGRQAMAIGHSKCDESCSQYDWEHAPAVLLPKLCYEEQATQPSGR